MSVEHSALDVERLPPRGAVFLSYASQDADAARRLCEALRAAGVEVWFDQNELVGGDAWDAKIRRQIKECALFVPIVSAGTNVRAEGYFRLEWRLAVERSQLMADDAPFLFPVVIDDTSDAAARVPDRFREVQWTRCNGGVATPAFIGRIRALLEPAAAPPTAVRPSATRRLPPAPARSRRFSPAWRFVVIPLAVLLVAGGVVALQHFRDAGRDPAAQGKAVAVAPAAAAATAAAAVPAKSVAVLPFKSLSPDREHAYFADGVHEDVITNLGKMRDLKVISRPSMLAYGEGAQQDLRRIAADLRVATILTGSVRRVANRVKVAAQLVEARTGEHLWGNDYEQEITDVFAIQSAIAREIAQALKVTLQPREQAQIARRPTENVEAYDLFVRARQLVGVASLVDRRARYDQAVALLDRAIALDRNFAEAYALLSLVHGHMYRSGVLDPTPARLAKLRETAEAVSRVAPDRPEARVARGNLQFFGLDDFGRALAEYRAAQADLPNDSEVARRIVFAERRLGRWHEALASFEHAAGLDPADESTAYGWVELLCRLRRWSAAQAVGQRIRPNLGNAEAFKRHDDLLQLETAKDETAARSLQRSQTNVAARVWSALAEGDFATAERLAAGPRASPVLGLGGGPLGSFRDLNLAKIAFLRGDPALAKTRAEAVLAELRQRKISPRLEPAMLVTKADALVLAGRIEEGLRDARTGMARVEASDAWDALQLRDVLGQIFIQAGRTDDALDTLRRIFAGPSQLGPNLIRLHPIWSRLKTDPRFEEILQSAKPH